jgi:small-conductance mechanosensitive channel/CRP-like cAMP-binding protein
MTGMDLAGDARTALGWMWPARDALLLTDGLVVVAGLLNRFAPGRRRRLRPAVLMYVSFVFVSVAAALLSTTGELRWLEVGGELLLAFTAIHLTALLLFDVVLPAISLDVVTIASDLALGVAYVVATAAILSAASVDLTSLVAASSIVAAVLTLSLQSTLGNVIGGVALQLDGSISVGDWIQLENGKQGKVKEIRWRHTVVETRDWDTVIVPNAALLAGQIIVLGKREGKPVQHRMWVYFQVDFRWLPSQVVDVVRTGLAASPIPNVAEDPPPDCIVMDLAKDGHESYGVFAVRYWLTDLQVDDPTSSRVRSRIHTALKRAGIPLSRPALMVFHAPADDRQTDADQRQERALAAVRQVAIFSSLTDEECRSIADHVQYSPFAEGETITRQGAIAHWLYIVVTGRADVVTRGPDGTRQVVATVEGPGFVGEMGLMTGEPRLASVIAKTDVDCYRLDKAGFETILHARPEIAKEISELLAKRRVELVAIQDGLDARARSAREIEERERILDRIRSFFGLAD